MRFNNENFIKCSLTNIVRTLEVVFVKETILLKLIVFVCNLDLLFLPKNTIYGYLFSNMALVYFRFLYWFDHALFDLFRKTFRNVIKFRVTLFYVGSW